MLIERFARIQVRDNQRLRPGYVQNFFEIVSGHAAKIDLLIPGALGLHYKRDLGGRAHFGPDLHFVAEENYEVEEDRLPGFADVIRRFWPGLPQGALSPDFAGIRPKLHGPGEKQPELPSAAGEPALARLDRLRHAKDKEEFDAFMAQHKQRPTPPNDQPSQG